MARAAKAPDDVVAGQLWKDPGGQHYSVIEVYNGRAAMHRATPGGRILNTRYRTTESVEKMQAEWQLVRG